MNDLIAGIKISVLFAMVTSSSYSLFADTSKFNEPLEAIAKVESFYKKTGGAASGMLISSSGLFLTNIHVLTACFEYFGEKDVWHPSREVLGKFCPKSILTLTFPLAKGRPLIMTLQDQI